MPRLLLDRCGIDCIAEFRSAARMRFAEAEVLSAAEYRLGGIYLCGYAAEMSLKAAYFSFLGYALSQQITYIDLNSAKTKAKTLYGIPFGNLHDLAGWAELLIEERKSKATAFPLKQANRLSRASQIVYGFWRETLRYRQNKAYSFEFGRVKTETQWLLSEL